MPIQRRCHLEVLVVEYGADGNVVHMDDTVVAIVLAHGSTELLDVAVQVLIVSCTAWPCAQTSAGHAPRPVGKLVVEAVKTSSCRATHG